MTNNIKINIVKNIICDYFFKNDLKNSCLAQSYILYKWMLLNNIDAKLIKGYIIDDINKTYWGHFWVENNNIIHDIATDTYLLYYDINLYDNIMKHRKLSILIPSTYKCLDNDNFENIRNKNYINCINDNFLIDVKQNATIFVYNKIYIICNLLKIF